MPSGSTIGIWIGEDDDLLDRFDREFGTTDPQWSRSKEVKEAMELHIEVQRAIDGLDGYHFDSEVSKRHWVRQALRDMAAREAGDAAQR